MNLLQLKQFTSTISRIVKNSDVLLQNVKLCFQFVSSYISNHEFLTYLAIPAPE